MCNNFKVGQVVRCINAASSNYLHAGAEYTVTHILGTNLTVKGSLHKYHCYRFEAVDKLPRVDTLTFDEVVNAIRNRKPLEYYDKHIDKWVRVLNLETLTFNAMNNWVFRTVVDTHDVNGVQVPRPNVRPVHFDEKSVVYGISFNKREVFKAPIKQFSGVPYWTKPEDAHKALVALLLPYGIQAKPLAERLLND